MHTELSGPAGRLESLLDVPAGTPRAAVLLMHPLPEYGGSMRSRVVHEAAKAFVRIGAAVLRFNFRGVGTSEGRFTGAHGELLDAKAGLDALGRTYPHAPLWTAGYSFGAWVALSLGAADERVTASLGIAPPVGHFDFSAAAAARRPTFLIHGEADEIAPLKAVQAFYARLAEPKELVVIDGAGHAFDGYASEVGDAVEDLFTDFETGKVT